MANQPLIDPFQIDRIVNEAKLQRAQYLRDQVITGTGKARWHGLAALVVPCFALFVSHGPAPTPDATGGNGGHSIAHAN